MTRRQRAHKRGLENYRARLRLALAAWPILAAIAITATNALASRPIEPAPVCWFTPFIGCDASLDAGAAGE